MIPEADQVTIADNLADTKAMLLDLVLRPRRDLIRWAAVTKQTPNVKIGYTGQHLASVVTGVEGARTGARGHDLRDGSEVKSCSRIDPLDKCGRCKAAVARTEVACPECASRDIKRTNDSKWLLAVRSEAELTALLDDVPRILLILSDYPHFDEQDWNTIQFQVFEIWPRDSRQAHFRTLMRNYFQNIFLKHIARNPNKTPAPKNLWPYSYQFYMCNPVRTFHCVVSSALEDPQLAVHEYVEPLVDRDEVEPTPMPLDLLKPHERQQLQRELGDQAFGAAVSKGLDSQQRLVLSLRDTDHATPQTRSYRRGAR